MLWHIKMTINKRDKYKLFFTHNDESKSIVKDSADTFRLLLFVVCSAGISTWNTEKWNCFSFWPDKKRLSFLCFTIYIYFILFASETIFFVSLLEKFVSLLLHYNEQSLLKTEYCLMPLELLFLHSWRETAS